MRLLLPILLLLTGCTSNFKTDGEVPAKVEIDRVPLFPHVPHIIVHEPQAEAPGATAELAPESIEQPKSAPPPPAAAPEPQMPKPVPAVPPASSACGPRGCPVTANWKRDKDGRTGRPIVQNPKTGKWQFVQ